MSNGKKVKLGWLFPYSGVFPEMKKDLLQGFGLALENEPVEIVVADQFIQNGGLKETEQAIKKLVLYDRVDLVIGVAGSKVVPALLPMLESRQTPLMVLNLGADLPTGLCSPFLFYNSLHLWKSQWALGKWAQAQYGGEPSINLGIYEGGYGLSEAFRQGTVRSEAATARLNILKSFSPVADTTPLVEQIAGQQADHIHVLLSGKEGQQFLELYAAAHRASTPGLTVNPMMVEDGLLTSIPGRLELYNASTWSSKLDTPANQDFVRSYTTTFGEPPSVFSLLSYEAGLGLAAALSYIEEKISGASLAKMLTEILIDGPRGNTRFSTNKLRTTMPVYLRLPARSQKTGTPENSILQTLEAIEWDDPTFTTSPAPVSGWQNPYLCV